jgi:hypothetical protein
MMNISKVSVVQWAAVAGSLLFLAGCGDGGHGAGGGSAGGSGGGGHHHGSAHGGAAVELGEHQYQLDIANDPATGVLKAWVMDGHMDGFVRVPLKSFQIEVVAGTAMQTVTMNAQANTATGETVGDTSQFEGQAPWLKGLTNFSGSVPEIDVRGTVYRKVKFQYPDRE